MAYIRSLLENCIHDKICIYSSDTTMYSMSYKKWTVPPGLGKLVGGEQPRRLFRPQAG
jgi:hypothetical protein